MKMKITFLLFLSLIMCSSIAHAATDQRETAHGMNFVTNPITGKSYLFWSDQYNHGSDSKGNWTHDIYYQEISLSNPSLSTKHLLINAPEAQEPASVSCTSSGYFFVTFEDGNTIGHGGLSQRYAIFDQNLKPLKAYPQTIKLGGHSGHGAASANKLITFWNNDWVEGGGVDNLGTGKDVYVTSMNEDSSKQKTLKLTKGNAREWWPIITASHKNALLVWQRYVKNKTYSTICYAIYNPATGKLNANGIKAIKSIKAKYYTYNAIYLKNIRRYVVNITTNKNKSVVLLLNNNGKLICQKNNLPAFAREASPAILMRTKTSTLCYPKSPSGVTYLNITKNKIKFVKSVKSSYKWGYRGTSGFYSKNGTKACFASLSKNRVVLKEFKEKKHTYYVSANGLNSNLGTKSSPFKTITYGISKLRAGDTLFIRGGTYHEELSLSQNGTANHYINISNYKNERVIISGENITSPVLLATNGTSYVHINGLELCKAAGTNSCGISITAGSSHLIFSKNYLHDISIGNTTEKEPCANGIILFGDSSKKSIHDIFIYKNKLSNCDTGWSECISASGNCTNLKVVSNTITNNKNIGIDFSGNYSYCKTPSKDFVRNSLISNNIVSGCVSPYATSYGIYVDGGQNISITNNHVTKCSGGIEIGAEQNPPKSTYCTKNITVKKNFISNNIENGITIGGYTKSCGWVKNVKLLHNTCRNNGLNNAILTLAKCSSISIIDNVFYNSSGNSDIVYNEFSRAYTKKISFSGNHFYNAHDKNDTSFVFYNKAYSSFAKWLELVGHSAGSFYL